MRANLESVLVISNSSFRAVQPNNFRNGGQGLQDSKKKKKEGTGPGLRGVSHSGQSASHTKQRLSSELTNIADQRHAILNENIMQMYPPRSRPDKRISQLPEFTLKALRIKRNTGRSAGVGICLGMLLTHSETCKCSHASRRSPERSRNAL